MLRLIPNKWLLLIVVVLLITPLSKTYSLPSVGSVTTKNDSDKDTLNPLKWVGEKFILLEKPKPLQHSGYGFALEDTPGLLPYNKYVGDILTVVSVSNSSVIPSPSKEFDFVLKDENKNVFLVSTTLLGVLNDVAPLEELNAVRKLWMGKTIWSKKRFLCQYDSDTGQESFVKIPLGERLKVVDVTWGASADFPVWIIVKTSSGLQGYYEVAGTQLNKTPDYYNNLGQWKNSFYDVDPRITYNWPSSVWTKVCAGEIAIGMTYDQVNIALGAPGHINRDIDASGVKQQWIYKDKYVYFVNGKASAIQEQ